MFAFVVAVVAVVANVGLAQLELAKGDKILNEHDPIKYKDCAELLKAGYNEDGTHILYMDADTPFLLRCEFRNFTAFNVIQRRINGALDFRQPLSIYINGFGSLTGDYWAGLQTINYLTQFQGNRILTIQMTDFLGISRTARYSSFEVKGYGESYIMYVSGFTGTGGLIDDFGQSNAKYFYTYDFPDTDNCALSMRAGWWYSSCAFAYLNGFYYNPPGPYSPSGNYFDGIFWRSWYGYNYSLRTVAMAVSNS